MATAAQRSLPPRAPAVAAVVRGVAGLGRRREVTRTADDCHGSDGLGSSGRGRALRNADAVRGYLESVARKRRWRRESPLLARRPSIQRAALARLRRVTLSLDERATTDDARAAAANAAADDAAEEEEAEEEEETTAELGMLAAASAASRGPASGSADPNTDRPVRSDGSPPRDAGPRM
jgi:uncharacterized membrane protein